MESKHRPERTVAVNATRLYSNGSVAYAYSPAVPKPVERPIEPQQAPVKKPAVQPQKRTRTKPSLTTGCKVCLFFSIATLCFAFSVLMHRYYSISNAHLSVNALQDNIDNLELQIQSLHVELDSAVTIQQVQDTAKEWGMTYPKADQYVRAGEPVKAPNANQEDSQALSGDTEPGSGGNDGTTNNGGSDG